MKSSFLFRVLLLAGILFTSLAIGRAAEEIGVVEARRAKRDAAVTALKDRQLVGENKRGYLEARGNMAADEQQTVSAENSDRRIIYIHLADEQKGKNAEQIGRLQAQQIAEGAKRGTWLQDPDGTWHQKR